VARMKRPRKKQRGRLRLPPWWPVVGVVVLIGAAVGVLFLIQGLRSGPQVGDHIHSSLGIYVWGEQQPDLPVTGGGVHSHGDGLIHIHPQHSGEESLGAALGKFFEYGGWNLTSDTLRLAEGEEYVNGDLGPDGRPGTLRVLKARTDWRSDEGGAHGDLTAQCSALTDDQMKELGSFVGYVAKDGDCVRIIFGPEGESSVYEASSAASTDEEETAE
jgi:hypothetical protein